MKKKLMRLTALVITFSMILSIVVCGSELDNQKNIEISFKVGDDTLNINGSPEVVEKPYVVGDGVTLVPLRVITEAFGADVKWEESTNTVTLDYPGINIELQIGNTVADVNEKPQTLLSAPELTDSGFTMVPLRFISETFGAAVSYNESTEQITVVKNIDTENGNEMVIGAISDKNIGDSYFGWSMENPTELTMDERYFDGTYTTFNYDENNYIKICVSPTPKDFDFDKDFTDTKDSLKALTLVKSDKDSSNQNNKSMHFQAKDKNDFFDYYSIITPTYIFDAIGIVENTKPEVKDVIVNTISTFKTKFVSSNEIYDLSNVKDGKRNFKSENMKLSVDIPENFYMLSDETIENSILFDSMDINDKYSSMHIGIYSKSDVESAEALAKSDFEHNKTNINENYTTFTDIIQNDYNDISTYEYSYQVKKDEKTILYTKDAFFEKGDYVYNASIMLDGSYTNAEETINELLNSIKAETLNPDDIGILMRNDYDTEGKFTAKVGTISFNLPNSFKEQYSDNSNGTYYDQSTGTAMGFTTDVVSKITYTDVGRALTATLNSDVKNKDATIEEPLKSVTINGRSYWYYAEKTIEDDPSYIREYVTVISDKIYTFCFIIDEMLYSNNIKTICEDIVKSASFKK